MALDTLIEVKEALRHGLPEASKDAIDAVSPEVLSCLSQLRAIVGDTPEFSGTDEQAEQAADLGKSRLRTAAALGHVALNDGVHRFFDTRTWAAISLWPEKALIALAHATEESPCRG